MTGSSGLLVLNDVVLSQMQGRQLCDMAILATASQPVVNDGEGGAWDNGQGTRGVKPQTDNAMAWIIGY